MISIILFFLFAMILIFFIKNKKKSNFILNISTSKLNGGGVREMQLKYQHLFTNIILLSKFDDNKIHTNKAILFFELIYYIIYYNPKLIISHCQKTTKLLKIINYFMNVPTLLHVIHGNQCCNGLENANIIFYLNKYQRKQLNKLKLENKSYYFPNFLESTINYKKTNKIKNIGIIGRFSDEKNFETIIESMKYLTDYKLIIGGAGPKEKKYLEIIRNLNLKNIEFLGWIKPNSFFKKIDILIVPSYYECFPLVSLEAINNSIIVVSSKNEGSLQIFNDLNKSIFVNDFTNSLEYANKIKYFSKNIDIVNKITKENHDFLINNFSLNSSKKRLNNVKNLK